MKNLLFPMDPKATQWTKTSRKNQAKEVRTNGSMLAPEIRPWSFTRRILSRPQSLVFLVDTSGLWFTSRVQKSLPPCSHSSCCSWISSQTRYAPSRMRWKAWWQDNLPRVTPPKSNKRLRSVEELLWKNSLFFLCCTWNGLFTRRLMEVRSL